MLAIQFPNVKSCMAKLKGKADGKVISTIVRELLAK